MVTYTVWVGGIADVEEASAELAQEVYSEWVNQGYDDVQIETVRS